MNSFIIGFICGAVLIVYTKNKSKIKQFYSNNNQVSVNRSKTGIIQINGKTYTGDNLQIANGKVIIDGEEADQCMDQIIKVEITGNVDDVETASGDVTVNGTVEGVETVSGNVSCGDVSGDVETVSGDVNCSKVYGDVDTVSGNVG